MLYIIASTMIAITIIKLIAIPKTINSTVPSLKMDTYNKLVDYLR